MDVVTAPNLLVAVLRDPVRIVDWGAAEWNAFLPQARQARLLGRCYYLFVAAGVLDRVPQRIVDQLTGALVQTRYVQNQAIRELEQVRRALEAEGIPLIALKGVAYLVADLPSAAWRNLADIDLLVPRERIVDAESLLKRNGWQLNGEFDAYDQHYYHDWMHEVPPLKHHKRETEVDIHHNLAPPVSAVKIDAERLWEDATSVGGGVSVLSPMDLLLHNTVHLFMNDELRGGLRDVVDFVDLIRHFTQAESDFEARLLVRAEQLGCGLPLYYAVDTACRLLALEVSADFQRGVRRHAPALPVRGLMRLLIRQTLTPARPGLKRTAFAFWLLFVRSHWVRMPLPMLLRHLARKAFKRGDLASTIDVTPG